MDCSSGFRMLAPEIPATSSASRCKLSVSIPAVA
jgi:hypothetical protein